MGIIFTDRPDTIWLLAQGCSFAQAFSILERGGTGNNCAGPIPSSVQAATEVYLEQNAEPEPEPAPPPPPPPVVVPPPEPEPEPIPEPPPPVVIPVPKRLTGKQKRIQRSRARSAVRRSKPIPSDVPEEIKSEIQAGMGFNGIVDKPTRFLVGESGRERVSVTPVPDFAMDDVFTPIRSGTKNKRKDVFTKNTDIFGMGSNKKSTNIFARGSNKKSNNIFDMGPTPKGIDSTLAFPSRGSSKKSTNIFDMGSSKKQVDIFAMGSPGRSKKRSNNNFTGFGF